MEGETKMVVRIGNCEGESEREERESERARDGQNGREEELTLFFQIQTFPPNPYHEPPQWTTCTPRNRLDLFRRG